MVMRSFGRTANKQKLIFKSNVENIGYGIGHTRSGINKMRKVGRLMCAWRRNMIAETGDGKSRRESGTLTEDRKRMSIFIDALCSLAE